MAQKWQKTKMKGGGKIREIVTVLEQVEAALKEEKAKLLGEVEVLEEAVVDLTPEPTSG